MYGYYRQQCGCGHHTRGCGCGHHRRYLTKEERKELLEKYLNNLEKELEAVKERLEELE